MRGLSAAHRSLPIPTYLKVTNLKNHRSVVVRVNDRGPFHSERIIDLSYGAATMLGFADQGTAPVLLESIDFPEVTSNSASPGQDSALHYLQIGAFSRERSAQLLKQRVEALIQQPVEVKQILGGVSSGTRSHLYRVYVGPFATLDSLGLVKRQLSSKGIRQSHRVSSGES